MPFPNEPTVGQPQWTDGGSGKQVEPSSGKKNLGWTSGEKPAFQFMNWILHSLAQWVVYLKGTTDELKSLQYNEFTMTVGDGKDYPSLSEALIDATDNDSILVFDNEDLDATLVVAQNNLRIRFMPGVTFADDGAGTAFELEGDRIVLEYVRLFDFTVGVDIDGDAEYCMISHCWFKDCDTPVNLDSVSSMEAGNIYEDEPNDKYLPPIGTVIYHDDFDGDIDLDPDYWRPCNGATLSYAQSPLNGKVLRDLSGRYIVGFGTDGGENIHSATYSGTPVGNAGHTINIAHDHAAAHYHRIPDGITGLNTQRLDVPVGGSFGIPSGGTGSWVGSFSSPQADDANFRTGTELSSTQSIQPRSQPYRAFIRVR